MSRTVRIIIGIVFIGALAGVAVLAYVLLSGGSGELSGAISAPTLAPETSGGNVVTFNIVPDESQVTFELDEELGGQPKHVVGTSAGDEDIAGQIRVNFDQPATSEIGTIRINVRSLVTDSDFRNRAIRSAILLSAQDEYEFGEFAPTAITGLPETITLGQPITFQVTGDLTLRGITQPVTFDAIVTPMSETRLEGSATTTVQRAMYEMNIPNAPNVANVSEDVILTIQFVATPGSAAEATEVPAST